MKTIAGILNHWVTECGERVFIHDDNDSLTYRQVAQYVRGIQDFLLHCGIRKGDKVAVSSPKNAGLVATYIALFGLGVIAVPISVEINAGKFWEICATIQPDGFFIHRDTLFVEGSARYQVLQSETLKPMQLSGWSEALEGMQLNGRSEALEGMQLSGRSKALKSMPLESQSEIPSNMQLGWLGKGEVCKLLDYLGAMCEHTHAGSKVDLQDLPYMLDLQQFAHGQYLVYDCLLEGEKNYYNLTSGSTGQAKIAWVGDAEVLANAQGVNKRLELAPDDGYCCMFPPEMHPHELFVRPLLAGSSLALLSTRHLRNWDRHLVEKKITQIIATPSTYETILALGTAQENWQRVKQVVCTGERYAFELTRIFYEQTGHKFIPAWGSTETTGIALIVPDHRLYEPAQLLGVPVDGYEIQLEQATGQLLIRGQACFQGYLSDAQMDYFTSEGFYRTGDLVKVDADGVYEFMGRINSLVKVGGRKVSLYNIENNLQQLEAVKEIAAVVATVRSGSVLGIFVVLNSGVQTFSLSEKKRYDLLQDIGYRLYKLESLPKAPSGKVDRKVLEQMLQDKLEEEAVR